MLEIVSHQYLKKFIKSHQTDWNDIYSFGITLISSLEGLIKSLIGNANIISEHSFNMPKSQLT